MKLIKAYIRTNMIDKVIHALEAGGYTDMTLVDVRAIRTGIDPKALDYSVELAERYMNVAKLEIVLQDEHVELARETILMTARTGRRGDGLVYVSPIDEAIYIRTGRVCIDHTTIQIEQLSRSDRETGSCDRTKNRDML